ncbi:unnamed protein product, partial [Didymodactylos carnosus]
YEIDISRSHRVGKYNPQSSTPRPIIVRFTSYRSRELFYKNRQYLNETEYYYVTAMCEQSDPAFVAITETWLDSSITDKDITMSGYTLHRLDRDREGGDVSCTTKTI